MPLRVAAACFAVALYSCQHAAAKTGSTVIVVQAGEPAPDGNGVFSQMTDVPALNDAGQVLFNSLLDGTSGGHADGRGLFLSDGTGGLTQIVRRGDAAPDGNGTFTGANTLTYKLNNAGQAAFYSGFDNTAGVPGFSPGIWQGGWEPHPAGNVGDDRGYFMGDGLSAPTRIARQNQSAPDGAGAYYFFSGDLDINDSGQSVFIANFTDASQDPLDQALLLGGGTAGHTLLYRTGHAAPDGNGTFGGFSTPSINSAGQILFNAGLNDTNGGYSDAYGMYLTDGAGGLTQLIRRGDPAPDGNGVYNLFSGRINDIGQVAVVASLTGVTNGASYRLLGPDGLGGLTQIVGTGDAAPDGNGVFNSFTASTLAFNNAGQIGFLGSVRGVTGQPNGLVGYSGIFRGDAESGLQPIARQDQATPSGNGSFRSLTPPAINDAGQMAFFAYLFVSDGEYTNDAGIFFYDDNRGLIEVVREGDTLLGSTITSIGFFTGNSSGSISEKRNGFNELGQIAYRFTLANGHSGIAIWSIPEPTSAALLALGGLAMLFRRTHSREHLETVGAKC